MRAGAVDQPEITRELKDLGRRSPVDGGGVDVFNGLQIRDAAANSLNRSKRERIGRGVVFREGGQQRRNDIDDCEACL